MLDIGDVSGSRVIETAYLPRVGVRDAHAAAALEVMSRFAIDPRRLLYLPPTMSPVATAARGDLLEHPDQAFGAYRADGVASVLRRPGPRIRTRRPPALTQLRRRTLRSIRRAVAPCGPLARSPDRAGSSRCADARQNSRPPR